MNHVNKHPQTYSIRKLTQQYMLEQKQKESKPSNVKHIKKQKMFGVPKHFHPVDDLIVYNGENTLELPKILDPIEKHDKIFKRNR